MMEFILLDLDDTILDFGMAERIALSETLKELGVEPTDDIVCRYHEINRQHWERLERGEITRAQVLTGRFHVLFEEMGKSIDASDTAKKYEHNLGIGHFFLPGAEEAIRQLSRTYRLFLVSNGTASVQHSRMTSAGLYPYFEKVFISQEIGYDKPSKAYFDRCFQKIPNFRREKAIIVGDSLTSDILGGINAGIRTCWVNPKHLPVRADIKPDYEIESIAQLEDLLKRIK